VTTITTLQDQSRNILILFSFVTGRLTQKLQLETIALTTGSGRERISDESAFARNSRFVPGRYGPCPDDATQDIVARFACMPRFCRKR
jgi:hypothetical protein